MINLKKDILFAISILIVLFIIIITSRERRFINDTKKDLVNQSATVSVNLWQFDEEACRLNLNFYSGLSGYTELIVSDYTGAKFCSADSLRLKSTDLLLAKLGLLRHSSFSEKIMYDGKNIGEISAIKLNLQIYIYFYLFIVLTLLSAVIIAVKYLSKTNSKLGELVEEKTKKLKSSEEELIITLNSIADGVLAIDDNGSILQINPSAKKILALEGVDCIGKLSRNLLSFDESNSETQLFTLNGETILSDTELAGTITINGKQKNIELIASPIKDGAGERIGVVFIFSDITEKIDLEERVKHSQKMESVGLLAGGIAHDFNNMLGGVIGPAELMLDDATGEQEEYLQLIISSAEGAADLTRKLLSFSRKGKVETSPVDVHTAINSTVTILKHTINKKISIITNLKASRDTILGDLNLLQNVFLNLAINSSHAIEGEGEISFSSKVISLSSEYCKNSEFTLKPGAYLEVKVTDNGCGISKANLKNIFDPFFTTKGIGKGTGLGLAASYGAIHEHQGEIIVDSIKGEGTTFRIFLPLTSPITKVAKNMSVGITKGKGNILVVDDEFIMRKTAMLMLERIGYTVILAENGLDAISVFTKNQSKIDLVLLDILMPKMDGRECSIKLREIDPKIKIIFASGFSRNTDDLLEEYNMDGFLRKPYDLKNLSEICATTLEK
jgi:two-component system cell cycle sensor histidine kinase/response regulator CckA